MAITKAKIKKAIDKFLKLHEEKRQEYLEKRDLDPDGDHEYVDEIYDGNIYQLLNETEFVKTEINGLKFDLVDNSPLFIDGAEIFYVLKVTDTKSGEEVHIKFDGYYSSWESPELSEFYLTTPYEVQVTRWTNKKGKRA